MNLFLKKTFEAVGLDVRLVRNVRLHERRTWEDKWTAYWAWLGKENILTVIDVGANTGQFSQMISRVCPKARIIAYEPVAACQAELEKWATARGNTEVHRLAVGRMRGRIEMNISEYTSCSSFLKPNDNLVSAYPQVARMTRESVEVVGLDEHLPINELKTEVLLKIDVQGYEQEVISGAERLIRRVKYVALEMTYYPEYDQQPVFDDLYQSMRQHGFVFRGTAGQYDHPKSGRPQYADCIFERV